MLTETGPKFVTSDEYEQIDIDPKKVVCRNGRYGFNCYGICVEGESPAVHYGRGEDELWISTVQSPNGRFSYSVYCRLAGLVASIPGVFCWDENVGWKDRAKAVTAALEFMKSNIEDYLADYPEISTCSDNIRSNRVAHIRLNPVLDFIEKNLKFWDPVLHQLRSN